MCEDCSSFFSYELVSMNRTLSSFVLLSPSGGGKSSLIFWLLHHHSDRLAHSISHTTRLARGGEQHRKHYYFCSPEEFRQRISNQDFVEWAEVHDHYYGTSYGEIHRIHKQKKSVILDIDIQGWIQLRDRLSPVDSVFILPPSFDEMRRRLEGRGSESFSSLARRYESCIQEISQMDQCSHVLINDNFEETAHKLKSWMIDGQIDFNDRDEAQRVSDKMREDILKWQALDSYTHEDRKAEGG